jgi:hypothetical protein
VAAKPARAKASRLRALQLARWSGFRRAAAYAIGRQRLQDQAAAYTRWAADRELDDQALARLRVETTRFDNRPLISIITPSTTRLRPFSKPASHPCVVRLTNNGSIASQMTPRP